MNENELLAELARLARQQEEASTPRDPSEAALLQPLDEAARARIADRVLALVGQEAQEAQGVGTQDAVQKGVLDTAEDASPITNQVNASASRGNVIPLRRRWLALAVPALAAAAALLLWLRPGNAPAPLAAFQMEVSGGRKAVRGSAEEPVLRVGPGDQVTLVLRPATAVAGAVAARVFVGPAGGSPALDAPLDGLPTPLTGAVVEVSPEGAIRITGLGPALAALPLGRYRLVVAVGRPRALPDVLPGVLPSGDTPAQIQILERTVERVAP